MVTINKRLAAFVLWFAVAAFASPSFAQQSDNHMSDARAKAIHEFAEAPHIEGSVWLRIWI
jgi:hypothetical protein